jgi:hypothetical protein
MNSKSSSSGYISSSDKSPASTTFALTTAIAFEKLGGRAVKNEIQRGIFW